MSQPANNPTAPLSLTALWTMTPQEDITTLTTRCGVHILVGVWVWKAADAITVPAVGTAEDACT